MQLLEEHHLLLLVEYLLVHRLLLNLLLRGGLLVLFNWERRQIEALQTFNIFYDLLLSDLLLLESAETEDLLQGLNLTKSLLYCGIMGVGLEHLEDDL